MSNREEMESGGPFRHLESTFPPVLKWKMFLPPSPLKASFCVTRDEEGGKGGEKERGWRSLSLSLSLHLCLGDFSFEKKEREEFNFALSPV